MVNQRKYGTRADMLEMIFTMAKKKNELRNGQSKVHNNKPFDMLCIAISKTGKFVTIHAYNSILRD